jgi:hypothetical protein
MEEVSEYVVSWYRVVAGGMLSAGEEDGAAEVRWSTLEHAGSL